MQLCVCIWRYKIIKWVILLKVVLFLIVYKRSAYIDQYQIQSIDCAIFIDYDFVSWFCWFLFICYYLLLIFLRPFNGKKWNLAMKVHWVFFLKGGWSLKVVTNIANPFAKQTPNEYLEGAESNLILPNFGSSTRILIRHIHIPHIGLLKFFLQTFPRFSLSNIPYCAAHWSFFGTNFLQWIRNPQMFIKSQTKRSDVPLFLLHVFTIYILMIYFLKLLCILWNPHYFTQKSTILYIGQRNLCGINWVLFNAFHRILLPFCHRNANFLTW